MQTLTHEEVEVVSGGKNAYFDAGHSFGVWYWAARDYMTDTVYPFWLG